MNSTHAPLELVIQRHYKAPPELVFRAWTDPAHLSEWWGPEGFETDTHHMDLRPGGEWLFTMRHPQAGVFPNRARYLEVDPPRRLAYLHDAGVDDDPSGFHASVDFEPTATGTQVTLRMVFSTPEARQRVVDHGAVEGGRQTLARLDAVLERLRAEA